MTRLKLSDSGGLMIMVRLTVLVALLGLVALYMGVNPMAVALVAAVALLAPPVLIGPLSFALLCVLCAVSYTAFIWYLALSWN